MLDCEDFLDGLIARKFTHLCVVPCSFAASLINAAINNPDIEYLPSANEAVALSIAAGIKMAGGKPLVIVQSSGLTNMGSCITSLLKPYNINVAMLVSWRSYSAGDSEIQHQHLATELPKLVDAYGFSAELLDSMDLNAALAQIESGDQNPVILLLKDKTFSGVALDEQHKLDISAYPSRMAYLRSLANLIDDSWTFIGTTGNTAREMHSCIPSSRNFYMAGNMGGALSIGLGAALQGKSVIVCGGDAEFAMHQGGLSTAGRYREKLGDASLVYLVFDNAANKSTGGQRSYQEHLDYKMLARACDLAVYEDTVETLDQFTQAAAYARSVQGPVFVHIRCSFDEVTPRPPASDIGASVNAFNKNGQR